MSGARRAAFLCLLLELLACGSAGKQPYQLYQARVGTFAAPHERQFRLYEPERASLLWAVAMVHRCVV
ncbi:hypothetical protein [Nitrobacter sp. TKz-YC02]|uniref:hypothetical protein n=1 Tax=Nitrobacter sp. TKz-YC02 TaxID=3398704 RepID=UPI003CEE671C